MRPGASDERARPQPGLDRLDELAAPLRAAGLEVALHARGRRRRALPAGVDLSAYRIVQEALTNTLRHARRRAAPRSRVRYAPDALELDVRDDGRGGRADADGGGRGHRRACASARRCSAARSRPGRVPGGGFRVHARLPLEAAP